MVVMVFVPAAHGNMVVIVPIGTRDIPRVFDMLRVLNMLYMLYVFHMFDMTGVFLALCVLDVLSVFDMLDMFGVFDMVYVPRRLGLMMVMVLVVVVLIGRGEAGIRKNHRQNAKPLAIFHNAPPGFTQHESSFLR
jgi:hypothetical protein